MIADRPDMSGLTPLERERLKRIAANEKRMAEMLGDLLMPPPPKKQKTPSKPSRPRVTCAPIAEASKRRSSRIAQLPAPNYNLDADDDSPRAHDKKRQSKPLNLAAVFGSEGAGVSTVVSAVQSTEQGSQWCIEQGIMRGAEQRTEQGARLRIEQGTDGHGQQGTQQGPGQGALLGAQEPAPDMPVACTGMAISECFSEGTEERTEQPAEQHTPGCAGQHTGEKVTPTIGRGTRCKGGADNGKGGWCEELGDCSQQAADAATAAAAKLAAELHKQGKVAGVKLVSPSQVAHPFWMQLPTKFARQFRPEFFKGDIELVSAARPVMEDGTVPNFMNLVDVRRNVAVEQQRGDVWEVVFNPKGKEGAYKNAGLSGGWAGFAKDQRLFPSDTVVFEKESDARMRAHVFRGVDYETEETITNAKPARIPSLKGIRKDASKPPLGGYKEGTSSSHLGSAAANQGVAGGEGAAKGSASASDAAGSGSQPLPFSSWRQEGPRGKEGDAAAAKAACADAEAEDVGGFQVLGLDSRVRVEQRGERPKGTAETGAMQLDGRKVESDGSCKAAGEAGSSKAAGGSSKAAAAGGSSKIARAGGSSKVAAAGGGKKRRVKGSGGDGKGRRDHGGVAGYPGASAEEQAEADRAWAAVEEVSLPPPNPLPCKTAEEQEMLEAGTGEFPVRRILGYKLEGGERRFLINWVGFSDAWNTWEPRGHLDRHPAECSWGLPMPRAVRDME